MSVKNIAILGSTGSIGTQTLDVIKKHGDQYNLLGIAAKDETGLVLQQIEDYNPRIVVMGDGNACRELKDGTGSKTEILEGLDGMCELAAHPDVDIIVVAVSGAVGIKPTLSAIQAGKTIALANKETLVAAGDLVIKAAYDKQAPIIPVDSEHSAIYQCLLGERPFLKTIWLTASGGPFRDYDSDDMENITVDMALKHPTWTMGPKITIDSATLMNKGLEVIEAHHLFATSYEDIRVVIHPESIIHSLIELVDGCYLAQMGPHDMRIPIQYALTYPARKVSPATALDLTELGTMHFAKPDCKRFPALKLAYDAGKTGGTMPAVLNAANEVAVSEFLQNRIKFTHIPVLVEKVMLKHTPVYGAGLDEIMDADHWARNMAEILAKKVYYME